MVHGGPGSSHAGFIPALPLADDRAVILYDQLDNGRSDAPNDPFNWTVERFVSEIDAIRAALNLRQFHLLGQSWGGDGGQRVRRAPPCRPEEPDPLQSADFNARAGRSAPPGA